MTTAAALIIGNELLTGKIQEGNLAFLGSELFSLGIELRRVVVCTDAIDVIVEDLNALRRAHDHVFTSGGVGPTHDDLTLPAVASAFDRPLVRAMEIETLIRAHHGDRTNDDHLRMADVPEGSRLLRTDDLRWPTIAIENVYLFPGVPAIFRAKFPAVRAELETGARFISKAVFTLCDEGEIAALLSTIAAAHPALAVGSYPRFGDPDHKLKVTFDGVDESEIDTAVAALVAGLPPNMVLRVS